MSYSPIYSIYFIYISFLFNYRTYPLIYNTWPWYLFLYLQCLLSKSSVLTVACLNTVPSAATALLSTRVLIYSTHPSICSTRPSICNTCPSICSTWRHYLSCQTPKSLPSYLQKLFTACLSPYSTCLLSVTCSQNLFSMFFPLSTENGISVYCISVPKTFLETVELV